MGRYRRAALFGAVLSCCVPACAALAEPPKWGPHIDLEGRWGEGRSLGDVGLFVPLWQSPVSLLFADLRFKYDNRDSMEGNFGLGLRHMLPSGWNLGAYGYFDRRRSWSGSYFNQATLGIEALSADWDLRANAYVPFGERTKQLGVLGGGAPFAELSGGTIQVVTPGSTALLERALTGTDAEVGWRLPVFSTESLMQLRAYAGGYWFDGGGLVDDIYGPRGRLELSFDDALGVRGARFTLGGEVQHDRLRGTQGYAVARLRIPLQSPERAAPKLTAQEVRMTERVVRDVDVVTGGGEKVLAAEVREAAINAYNGQTVTTAVQIDAASGHAALQTALDNGTGGGVVILNGTLTGPPSPTWVYGTLLGGGAVLPVQGAVSGAQVNFTAPGTAGSLIGPMGFDTIVQVTAGSVAGGLTVENTSLAPLSLGIQGFGSDGATVFGNTVRTAQGEGIIFDSSNGVTITGNAITAGAADGIALYFSNNAMVSDNMVTAGNGVNVFSSTGVTISGNAFGTIGHTVIGYDFAGFAAGSGDNTWTGAGLFLCGNAGGGATGNVFFTDIDGNGTPAQCPP